MYRIIGYNGPRTKNQNVIYDIHENKYVDEAKLTLKDSTQIDDLEITVNKKNWLFTHNHPFKTHVEVYDDNKLIFRGRLLKPTKEMKSSGQLSHTYTFESIEAYLVDSAQRFYYNYNATATEVLKHILKWHNKDVSKSHQVWLKRNDFEKSKTTHSIKIDYMTSWEALNDVLIKKFGGQLNFIYDKETGKNYLDYIDNQSEKYVNSITHNSPVLQIGSNLKSINFGMDPSNVVTRLVPLGVEKKPKKVQIGSDYTVDADGSITGATKKVHGSWRDAVKHAARLMNVSVSASDVDAILNLIKHESGGHTHAVNPTSVLGQHATGLLQFLPTTFNYYAVAGHHNIRDGFDSLLAAFNAPSFLSDARNWEKTRNWSPSGDPRYSKIPYKYESKSHLKTLNKWGWPFPSVGEGKFSSAQLFGVHAGNGRRNSFHDGLDFGSVDHAGSEIHAIHGGTVMEVSHATGIGWYVLTHSSDGYDIIYQESFSSKSKISVKKGQHIKTGNVIGNRDTNHVHIGVCKKPYSWSKGFYGGHSFDPHWHWLDPLKLIKHGGQKGDKASTAKYYKESTTPHGRITIKSVNKDKDYILADKDMIEKFGYIAKPVIFNSAKTPAGLLKKAQAYLKKQKKDFNKESYKISALELPQYDKFKVGHRYPTQTFGLVLKQEKYLLITQKEIDIPNSPYNSSLQIGDKATGIADYQVETNNEIKKQIVNLQNDVIGLTEAVPELQTNTDDLEDKVYGDRNYSEAGIGHAKADVKFLRRDFNKFKKETKQHFNKVDEIQKDHETRIKKIESEVATLSASVSALQSAKPEGGKN
ncbi:prophage protein [Lactobacillus amylovorus]|uniref:Prophage protein n=1 Tax=Lactobacillus amylovorus TaxID=1604 RepID=F0TFC7_LACAM|nr:peptidoglycan DD-metalloendopeptidase family protein [Lactobacillus amylovorus]ADZ07421.1 prophage protein [Lactobacillus amylovorus]